MTERNKSFRELQSISKNALEQVKTLAYNVEWKKALHGLYWQGVVFCSTGLFAFDISIIQRISTDDFTDYFLYTLRGIEYAERKWGGSAIPSKFEVFVALNHSVHGLIPKYIGYNRDKDEFGITLPHIFEEVNGYNGRALSSDIHLPKNVHVSPEAHTTLQAIEECRHRYQVHGLGLKLETLEEVLTNSNYHKENENEREISSVWIEAIKDLQIKTYT